MAPPPAHHLHFELLEEIGRGEVATVYRALDRVLNRFVAIKELNEPYRSDPEHLRHFWDTAQYLAKLDHEHVVKVFGIDRDRCWIIMELLRGSVRAVLAAGPVAPLVVASVLRQTLLALECLHEHHALHGAVKPGNLLLDGGGRVKLGDAAGVLTDRDLRTPTDDQKYLAPELISGEFGPVGPPIDLYCAGFTALELLSGPEFGRLFSGVGASAVCPELGWLRLHGMRTKQLPRASDIAPGVPIDLADVIDRLLNRDVADRYPSATAALHDLVQRPLVPVVVPHEAESAGSLCPNTPVPAANFDHPAEPPLGATAPPPTRLQRLHEHLVQQPGLSLALAGTIGVFLLVVVFGLMLTRRPPRPVAADGDTRASDSVKAPRSDDLNPDEDVPDRLSTGRTPSNRMPTVPTGRSVPTRTPAQTLDPLGAGRSLALIVGSAGPDELQFAFADADTAALARLLGEVGYHPDNVTLLNQKRATAEQLRTAVRRLTNDRAPTDSIFLVLVGPLLGSEATAAFCPADSLVNQPGTLVPLSELTDALAGSRATRKLVVIDGSRSLHGARPNSQPFPQVRLPDKLPALLSCSPGQVGALHAEEEHGLFFSSLLAGLRGDADRDGDGRITYAELTDYVTAATVAATNASGRPQRPLVLNAPALNAPVAAVLAVPRPTLTALRSGLTLERSKEYPAASAAFTEALRLDPANMEALARRAAVRFALRDFDGVRADGVAIEKLAPTCVLASTLQGDALVEQGHAQQALPLYDRAIALDPLLASSYFARGVAHLETNTPAEALRDLNRALELAPTPLAVYHEQRALAYQALHQPNRAIEDLSAALQLAPADARLFARRGALLRTSRDLDKAVLDFNRAVELNPTSASVLNGRALVALDQATLLLDRRDEAGAEAAYRRAVDDCTHALRHQPNFSTALNTRGVARAGLKQYHDAITDYSRAIELRSDYARAYYNRGMSYAAVGNAARAKADLATAKKLGLKGAPSLADFLHGL